MSFSPDEQIIVVSSLQVDCPKGSSSKTVCQSNPNSKWFAGATGATGGTCVCCNTDGRAYVDPNATSPATACKGCEVNAKCGSHNGYCAELNNPNCKQDPTTKKWSIKCPSGAPCGNGCSGSCGAGEWYAFQSCFKKNNGDYGCDFTFGQWKSWIFYLAILVFLGLLIFLLVMLFRGKPEKKSELAEPLTEVVPQPTVTPTEPTTSVPARRSFTSFAPYTPRQEKSPGWELRRGEIVP